MTRAKDSSRGVLLYRPRCPIRAIDHIPRPDATRLRLAPHVPQAWRCLVVPLLAEDEHPGVDERLCFASFPAGDDPLPQTRRLGGAGGVDASVARPRGHWGCLVAWVPTYRLSWWSAGLLAGLWNVRDSIKRGRSITAGRNYAPIVSQLPGGRAPNRCSSNF